MTKFGTFFFLFILASPCSLWATDSLTLSDYLNQVRQGNGAYRASNLVSQGAQATAKEGRLLTQPRFFGTYDYSNDRKPNVFSSAFGNQTISHEASAGIQEDTVTGTQIKAGYQFIDSHINGVNPLFIPTSHYSTASPAAEIRQSLLRNGFGREVRAQEEALRANAMATAHTEKFHMAQVLSDAKRIYWRLALAREEVGIRRELLRGGHAILDWANTQMTRQLVDRSDFLQAQAAVKLQELELKTAVSVEKQFARLFNTLRGSNSDQVEEKLITSFPPPQKINPEVAPLRHDTLAAQEANRAAIAEAKIARENNLPSLDLKAGVALNSLSSSQTNALNDSFQKNPTVTAGVQFSVPLNFWLSHSVRQGYQLKVKGYEEASRQQKFSNDRNYADLSARVSDARTEFTLARQIENAQKEKFSFENGKLPQGKSTTFQVLTFQKDYSLAQLARLQIQAQVIDLETELDLYRENK
jgi:outer membrane protein TolC